MEERHPFKIKNMSKAFIKEFWKDKKMIGSILPSSKFLAAKMLNHIPLENTKLIIELGPGTGIFTEKIIEKIDDNLNSDKIGNSLNNLINTSQKTSTFAVLEKQITNENKINIQNEKINIQKEEEKNEDLNKSVNTHCSKYKNQTQQYNKSLAVNVLMNNLKSNNASIYHSFGDLNQLVPTIKITNNQEINEEITELIENNTIELVETLKSSNTINKDETNKKNIMNIVEKLDKIIITKRNVSLKIFYNKIKSTTIILRSIEKNFYIKNFLNKIRYIRDINFKKNIRKERQKKG